MRQPLRIPRPNPDEILEGAAAISEAAAFAEDVDLSRLRSTNDYNNLLRLNRREEHIHRITVCGLYAVAFACFVMFFVLVAQYTLPDRWRLLTLEETGRLTGFLFSGAVGSFVSSGARRLKREAELPTSANILPKPSRRGGQAPRP